MEMKIKRAIWLYFLYASAVLRSAMQYKLSFFFMIIGRFFVAFNSFLGIFFLFSGFSGIKGYTYGDVLLCFFVMQMSFSLAEFFARGFGAFAGIVKNGEFDRILLRPCSPILQVLGARLEIGQIGPMMTAILMLMFGIKNSQIYWSIGRVATLFLMLAGGTLLFVGLFMVGAAVCFFSLEESGCMNVLTYGAKEHGKYPIDIYGKGMLRLCTYVIPYTLVQYYPLQYLLGKTENWYYALFPLGTILFLLVCYTFWRFGMRHYTSSGS